MVRNSPRRLFYFVLPLALIGLNICSSEAYAQKVKETIIDAPITISMIAEPNVITVCEGQVTSPLIQLNTQATFSGNNPLRYSWRTTGGRIQGEGATVSWDLAGLQPGYYRAYVTVDSGTGDELCQAFSSTTILVNRCPAPVPVCPTVVISCPNRATAGQPLEFTATVSGGTPNLRLYNWSVSAGSIISGQGSNTIRVDTAGLAGSSVRASLSMGGFPMDCSASCAVQFPVPIEPRKFDEFPKISHNDEKARLDNYAIELHNDPTATAYVIVYPGQQGRAAEVQRQTTRIVEYMTNSRGIDARRIVTVVGPTRPQLTVELWICPQGCKPPTPTP